MSEEYDRGVEGLQASINDGVNLALDIIRRKALYPDLASMDQRTHRIGVIQSELPVNKADSEKTHLLLHIDMLKKELRKYTS